MHFELHYTQDLIGRIFGVSQEYVSQEINLIRKLLTNQPDRSRTGKPYQPRRERKRLDLSQVMQVLWILSHP